MSIYSISRWATGTVPSDPPYVEPGRLVWMGIKPAEVGTVDVDAETLFVVVAVAVCVSVVVITCVFVKVRDTVSVVVIDSVTVVVRTCVSVTAGKVVVLVSETVDVQAVDFVSQQVE